MSLMGPGLCEHRYLRDTCEQCSYHGLKEEVASLRERIAALIKAGDAIEIFAEGFARKQNITRVDGDTLEYWQGEWRKAKVE